MIWFWNSETTTVDILDDKFDKNCVDAVYCN